jgi:hypothetical protein
MGFWSNLFGKKKPELLEMDVATETAGKVVFERASEQPVDLDETIKKAEELLKAVAPAQDLKISEDLEKKRKRSEAAKKAAATRAANKAKKQ